MRKWIIFLILPLVLGTALAYAGQPDTAPASSNCSNIKSIGMTSDGYTLDSEKVIALTTFDYDCAKNILGLWDYDFFIAVTDIGGTYELINGGAYVAYGLWPGKKINDVIYEVGSGVGTVQLPPYRGLTGFAIIPPPKIQSSADFIARTTPDPSGFKNAKTFSRLMLLDVGGSYTIVMVTLGVWK